VAGRDGGDINYEITIAISDSAYDAGAMTGKGGDGQPVLTVFQQVLSRSAQVARQLLGDNYGGIVVSDR